MPDLLASPTSADGSHESFHSTHPSPLPGDNGQVAAPDLHVKAMQADGLPVYEIDAFLNDPSNQLLLDDRSTTKNGKTTQPPQKPSVGGGSSSTEPIHLGGPRTSQHVKLLYELCRSRGLEPEFDIEGGDSSFSGSLTMNGETVSIDQRFRSKKDAKEALAEEGVEMVRRMAQIARPVIATGSSNRVNWRGKLQEYFDVTTPMQGPAYADYGVGQSYACTCEIPGNTTVFGGTTTIFSSKQAARVNAAREAMQSLIEEGLVESDGSLKSSRKKVKLGTAVEVEHQGAGVKKNTTFAQKVNDLCPILGLTAPTYRISALSLDAPNIVSGAAVFPTSPLFPSPLGEVRNVFGKKNAKEECAKSVWKALTDLARSRGIKIDDAEEEVEMAN